MPVRIADRAIILGGGATAHAFEPPRYLVYPHLPFKATWLLLGPPKHGKSFVATMLAWSCASEADLFLGYELDVRGPVVYVAAEGALDQQTRFEALRQQRGPRDHPIHLLPLRINLAHEASVSELAEYIRGCGAVLVVIDTANRCGAGAEDTKDMGAFADGLTQLQASITATVVVIHHSPQADATRSRGSSVLPALVDGWWVSAKEKGGLFSLTIGEGRGNSADEDTLATYRLNTYILRDADGRELANADGRVVTVGMVQQCDGPEPAASLTSEALSAQEAAMRRACAAVIRGGVNLKEAMFAEKLPDSLYPKTDRLLRTLRK